MTTKETKAGEKHDCLKRKCLSTTCDGRTHPKAGERTISVKMCGEWSPEMSFETFEKLSPNMTEIEAVSLKESVTYERAEEIRNFLKETQDSCYGNPCDHGEDQKKQKCVFSLSLTH